MHGVTVYYWRHGESGGLLQKIYSMAHYIFTIQLSSIAEREPVTQTEWLRTGNDDEQLSRKDISSKHCSQRRI